MPNFLFSFIFKFLTTFSTIFLFYHYVQNSRSSKKTYFCNTSQARNRLQERKEVAQRQGEINKLCELLTKVLDQFAIHDTEISCLEKELTLQSSFSENIIRLWQVHYHMLRESYLSLRRNIEELQHQHQKEVKEIRQEHSRAYWNVNNSILTINFYWKRMMMRNIQLQVMYNHLDILLVQRSKHFSFSYKSHYLD